MIRFLYNRSGIEFRHSVIDQFQEGCGEQGWFSTDENGRLLEPGTGERNRLFTQSARRLVVEAGQATVSASGFDAASITHVITVSCTGFYNPGPDLDLVKQLGLSTSVERYQLGFMGCYGVLPALRMARQFCAADPDAVVLIASIELCSLHLQIDDDLDQILGNALFADGCAAAIVSSTCPPTPARSLRLESFHSALVQDGEGDMAWDIGDRGFRISLSGYVPDLLSANCEEIVDDVLKNSDVSQHDIGFWAIHPGGKAILDKLEASLGLASNQIAPSRDVLRAFGNMSSATLLFVLRELFQHAPPDDRKPVCALAFGPGLTVEGAVLHLS